MPAGRPTKYSEELAEEICSRLIEGESMARMCREDAMPSRATLFKWLTEIPEFSDMYRKARAAQAEFLADELSDISDDGTNDYMEKIDDETGAVSYKLNGEHVTRSKLRVDTRKWIAARLLPRVYGDKIGITDGEGGPIQVVIKRFSDD